ncbi:MAG: ParB/RepB/Spo0J family partition protein [Treponema sp.]|nr:ParB/RepB/Spo0J family partition protein [Treponema sp.]
MSIDEAIQIINEYIGDDIERANEIRAHIKAVSQPIDHVIWVPVEKVYPNSYNPNSVAKKELALLKKSIEADGYTQPIVTVKDEDGRYCIIDGFHRYFVGKSVDTIKDRNKGYLPIVVLEKTMEERMAATVRHNRARGTHGISNMSKLVFNMLSQGMDEKDIANELGMEAEEVLRLKHITGFSKLFEDKEYGKAWETTKMAAHRVEYLKNHPDEYGVSYE